MVVGDARGGNAVTKSSYGREGAGGGGKVGRDGSVVRVLKR